MRLSGNRRRILRNSIVHTHPEPLEDRCVLAAATPGVFFEGATLRIVTDEGADNVVITDDGAGNISAEITTETGDVLSGGGTGVKRVVFNGRGDDTVNYTATGVVTVSESLYFSLGRDGATANFDFSAGIEGTLNAIVLGGVGDDAVSAQFGDISGKLRFGAELVGGTDSFDFAFLGDILAGGQALLGANTFGSGNFNVTAQDVDIEADAILAIALAGGRGADSMSVNYQGLINGTLSVLENGGLGNDTLASEINIAEGSTGKLYATVFGSLGDDTQTLNVIDNTSADPVVTAAALTSKARGLGGSTTTNTQLAVLRAIIGDVFGANTLTHTDNVKVIEPPPRLARVRR